jgi:hypothetical protein
MRSSLVCVSILLCACGGSLPTPTTTQHPLSAYVEVPYPPPAALAETVPDRPTRADAVYIDGEWAFHGEAFVWRRGGWVVPPTTSTYAAWRAWYRRDGRLMMAPGTWYDSKHERLRPPVPLVPAYTPANEITSEFQTGR